jgi:16S rRNA (adenine1518-N6/adenine1519-N6)-dimethyltransferase
VKPDFLPSWKPRKRWGQHFLRDAELARRIAALTEAKPGDRIIEIGPGTGSLTRWLLERTPQVTAVEVDAEAVAHLRHLFPELDVRHLDVRRLDWESLLGEHGGRVILCGNLPYYLSGYLIRTALRLRNRLQAAVFMLQREVAERLVSVPGRKSYGTLSVLAQLWSRPSLCLRVAPGAFYPPPEVESAVVRLLFDRPPLPVADQTIEHLLRRAFGQRRKTLRNNFKRLDPPLPEELLARWGGYRAEELPPEIFLEMALAYEEILRCRERKP